MIAMRPLAIRYIPRPRSDCLKIGSLISNDAFVDEIGKVVQLASRKRGKQDVFFENSLEVGVALFASKKIGPEEMRVLIHISYRDRNSAHNP